MSDCDSQVSIIERLDQCLARMVGDGEAPRAMYLTEADRNALGEHHTRVWQAATGSTAYVWPTSHEDVPIIAEHLIDKVEVPVRLSHPEPRVSAIYAATGRRYPVDLV